MADSFTKKPYIIIPALNPDDSLIGYCDELIAKGLDSILLVDDGSDAEYRHVFEVLSDRCDIIKHDVNKGKGVALKAAFAHFLALPNANEFSGVVTCDCDGQHLAQDVKKIALELEKHNDTLILGTRDFSGTGIPKKSLIGNNITKFFYKLFVGGGISDTQTGLRGIPNELLVDYVDLTGNRYDYEMSMLVKATESKTPVLEIPINVIYNDNNAGTHYRPFKDAVLVGRILAGKFIKYAASGFVCFLLDILLFHFTDKALRTGLTNDELIITIASVSARVISSICNYLLNRNTVFKQQGGAGSSLVKYYILAACQLGASTLLVMFFFNLLGLPETIVKIVVDCFLCFISFNIQKRYVFKDKK